MKKIITSAAVAALALILFVLPVCASSDRPFEDVKPGAWYAGDVAFVKDNGIMTGTSATKFSPDGKLTRAMYVTLIYRLHGAEGKYRSDFSDVPAGKWYADPVGWAQSAGIVGGYGDGTFRPDREITRQELAAMTARYLAYAWATLPDADGVPDSFSDGDVIASWAKAPFDEMRRIGLLRGDAKARANPAATATRAETATMAARLKRALDALPTAPSVGGEPIGAISFYCSFMTDSERDGVVRLLGEKTGLDASAAAEPDGATVRAVADPSLPRLAYRLEEKDGALTLSIPTEFNADRVVTILGSAISARRAFTPTAGYSETGAFTLPSVTETEGAVEFFGETDKNPLAYRVGEEVTFRISLLRGGRLVSVPRFVWRYTPDSGREKIDFEDGYTGQIILKLPGCTAPGCAMLKVEAANKKGYPISSLGDTRFTGGVAFDFEKIAIAVPEPDDFDEFWRGQIALLDGVPPEILEEYDPVAHVDGWDTYSYKISAYGDPAYVLVTVPKNAEPRSLGIVANFYGYGVGSADYAYRPGCITVSVNPHSIENYREEAYYAEKAVELDGFGFGDDTRETVYQRGMLLRDVQAIRFVADRFGDLWDGVSVTTTGGSMGGFQATAVAALCPLVTGVETSITWMCDLGGETAGRARGWLPGYSEAYSYYDSVSFAARVTCPAAVYAGLGDTTCVPSGVIAMYNAFGGEKRATFVQNRDHGYVGGAHSYSFGVTGGEIPEGGLVSIVDTGVAFVPVPEEKRVPNETELRMNEAAEKLRKTRPAILSLGDSTSLSESYFEDLILTALTEKHGLTGDCAVVLDPDCFEGFLNDYRATANGGSCSTTLDYTLSDSSGNYVVSSARFLITKNG